MALAARRQSRYNQGGVTDEFDDRIGWWERTVISKESDDITYTIDSSESGRADLIAYRFYRRATLDWVVLQFNHIVDPVVELTTGTVITLPTPARVALTISTALA